MYWTVSRGEGPRYRLAISSPGLAPAPGYLSIPDNDSRMENQLLFGTYDALAPEGRTLQGLPRGILTPSGRH